MSVSLFFMAIANFDIIPHEDINGFIFDFEDFGVATPVRFQSLEFKTYNFVSNSGTTLWFIFIWIFASIFTLMISKCSNRLVQKLKAKLSKSLFFGIIIRILLECYLELTISAFLNLKFVLFNFSGEIFSSILAFFFIMVVLAWTFLLNYYITSRRRHLNDE